jgi:hypothetical protein
MDKRANDLRLVAFPEIQDEVSKLNQSRLPPREIKREGADLDHWAIVERKTADGETIN